MVAGTHARALKRAFTLAELMAVVTIVAVLAVLAVYGVRKYVFAAKSTEAMHIIGLIKTAEESFREETFSYLDVSTSIDSYYPRNPVGQKREVAAWDNPAGDGYANWRTLGINTDAPVEFGYAVKAGAAGANPPATGAPAPNATTEPWYVVKAVADRDQDGTPAVLVGSSFTTELFVQNEAE